MHDVPPSAARAVPRADRGPPAVALGCVAAGLFVLGACGVRLNSLAGISGAGNLRAEFHLGACPPDLAPGAVAQVGTGQGSHVGQLLLSGGLPLGGAEVALVDAVGQRVASVQTDGCGRYRFEGLAPGSYSISYQVRTLRGTAAVRIDAEIAAGSEVITEVDTRALRVGVFEGRYDHVERILERMGIRYQSVPLQDLLKTDLSRFDLVFVNCSDMFLAPNPKHVAPVLRAFVDAGGALYVSDLALSLLQVAWPDRITSAKKTTWPSIETARAVRPDLLAYLRGAPSLPLIHDLPGWKKISRVGEGVETLIANSGSGEPHMVLFQSGKGVVGYTTFHHEAQINDAMLYSLVFMISRF